MSFYAVRVNEKVIKSFRVNRFGRTIVYYSKPNEPCFWTEDKDFALKVVSLLDGELQEVPE